MLHYFLTRYRINGIEIVEDMMKRRIAFLRVLSAALFYFCTAAALVTMPLGAAIPAQERAALIALYQAADGDDWKVNTGWKDGALESDGFGPVGSEGSWYGITVSGDHVTKIELVRNWLDGLLPAECGNLVGLEQLNLSDNGLSDSIPPELGNLNRLVSLDLSSNLFSGFIPAELGNLSQLKILILRRNKLNRMPPELGDLDLLEHLDIGRNTLYGSIPEEFGNLAGLRSLELGRNQLTGEIPPELGNLWNLRHLSLGENHLSGGIPPELGDLENLESLFLSNNRLSGVIPSELAELSRLRLLALSTNKLTGSIPSDFTNLSGLLFLSLAGNALYVDETDVVLSAFLDANSPGWDETQTVAPADVSAAAVSSTSITLSWTPIVFTAGDGGYDVYGAVAAGGPYNYIGAAPNKSAASYTVTGLCPGGSWYFVIKSRTEPFEDNENIVLSDYSREVSAVTPEGEGNCSLTLSRGQLVFAAVAGGDASSGEGGCASFTVIPSLDILGWNVSADVSWLTVSPVSGVGVGEVRVSADPSGLPVGTYTGAVTVSAAGDIASMQTVAVTLNIYAGGATAKPFGELSTPLNNFDASGSIPVTGWVLDDVGVKKVEIYYGETGNLVYVGDAVLVKGARPDIIEAYPDYPNNDTAGWGYMLLSHFLPNGGNGTTTLHAVAEDIEGNTATLGTVTFNCDNTGSVIPFGAIDTPSSGGIATGQYYPNFGWALTPQPNMILSDNYPIAVLVDGVKIGHSQYGLYRSDIADAFPGYQNSDGAVGLYYLDTTAYADGVHTISWVVRDNAGNEAGVGSRYFTIENSGDRSRELGNARRPRGKETAEMSNFPLDDVFGVGVVKGYREDAVPVGHYPGDDGTITIEIPELRRLEIHLPNNGAVTSVTPPPIGSTLDAEKGIFYWQPGPGFLGSHRLMFIIKKTGGEAVRKEITVFIRPRGAGSPLGGWTRK